MVMTKGSSSSSRRSSVSSSPSLWAFRWLLPGLAPSFAARRCRGSPRGERRRWSRGAKDATTPEAPVPDSVETTGSSGPPSPWPGRRHDSRPRWFRLRGDHPVHVDAGLVEMLGGLFNKICGDHLEAPGEIQVYDIKQFEGVRATEIRKLFVLSISLSNSAPQLRRSRAGLLRRTN